MKLYKRVKVKGLKEFARGLYILSFCLPEDFPLASPGQFVWISPQAGSTFGRPFSIFNLSKKEEVIQVLIKEVGPNTKALLSLNLGDEVEVMGPLGNGLAIEWLSYDAIWMVGGSVGVSPLMNTLFFLMSLGYENFREVKIFYGAQTGEELCLQDNGLIAYATDDGSKGFHGYVTVLFEQELEKIKAKKILVITCGPKPMMQRVAQVCEGRGIECQVILENVMACSIGLCLGCSIPTGEKESPIMKRVCKEGPVFNALDIKEHWHEI